MVLQFRTKNYTVASYSGARTESLLYLVQLLVDCYLLIFCLDVLDLPWKKDGHVRDHCYGWLLMSQRDCYQVGASSKGGLDIEHQMNV